MRIRIALLLLALSAAGPALARDILVNNVSGHDGNSGTHWESSGDQTGPLRTIGQALALAENGDHIVLAKTDTPYHESVALVGSRRSGSPFWSFTIEGNGAVLDGSAPIAPESWVHVGGGVYRFRPAVIGSQQLFLNGAPVPLVPATVGSTEVPKLKPLEWSLVQGCLYFRVEKGKLPLSYRLSHTALDTGITLVQARHVVIRNLTVQGFRIDGINAFNTAQQVQLIDVTARGNGRAGIVVGGASLVDLQRCKVGDNSYAQILTLPYSETHVRDTLALPLTAAAWVDQGGCFYLGDKRVQGGLEKIGP